MHGEGEQHHPARTQVAAWCSQGLYTSGTYQGEGPDADAQPIQVPDWLSLKKTGFSGGLPSFCAAAERTASSTRRDTLVAVLVRDVEQHFRLVPSFGAALVV